MIRKFFIFTFFTLLTLLFSCNDKLIFVICSQCVADEPITADIKLNLEPGIGNSANVYVYRGLIEDSVLVDSFTTQSVDYTYTGEINTKYTFAAEYFTSSGKTIIAIDTAWPRVKYEKQQCQNPCYYIYDTTVNLRVKYH